MKKEATTNILLLVIAAALVTIAARPYVSPRSAQAQAVPLPTTSGDVLYLEPGIVTLRSADGYTQVPGKMVVDLNTGSIWGFPTLNGQPYPIDISTPKPPVSHPMYLGRFAFEDINK